jgi:branched-chain amino acid transport system permease protein
VNRFVFLTIDGLTHGAVYAAFGLALVLIWRGTRVVNFAQGTMAVAAAYIAFSVTSVTGSYWLGALAAVAAGALIGAVVERGVMRRVTFETPLTAIVVALGVSLVIDAVLGMLYGVVDRPFPVPFSQDKWGGLISPYDVFVFVVVGLILAGIAVLFTRTPIGLRMRAAAFAPETARLLGVNVGRVLTFGWVLAAAVGAIASLLIVPLAFLNPTAMDLVFVSAFTAAVIGGLDSPAGAVVGGLALGLVLSYATGYLHGDNTSLAVLIVLAVILLVRPEGLFSKHTARRV